MDLVKTFAIFSVFIIKIEMIPVLLSSEAEPPTLLKVPKDIKPGTNITILGNNKNVGMYIDMLCMDVLDIIPMYNVCRFTATFSGKYMDKIDECTITFIPNQDKDQFKIEFENQGKTIESTTYDIDPNNKEVSFTLHAIARTFHMEEIMDLLFEETDRGQEPIGCCRFSSFESLEYIVFKGVEHVKNLSFNFTQHF